MQAAWLLGSVIVMGLIVADWIAFNRKTPARARYGVVVTRERHVLQILHGRFDPDSQLALPHGAARLYLDCQTIQLLPDWKRFGLRFRTAWPLNAAIHYQTLNNSGPITLVRRMPWSSVVLTAAWFLTVAVGILAYLLSYAKAGGFASARGALVGLALSSVGLLVLLFGVVVVVSAYRLENKRLRVLYDEFRTAVGQD